MGGGRRGILPELDEAIDEGRLIDIGGVVLVVGRCRAVRCLVPRVELLDEADDTAQPEELKGEGDVVEVGAGGERRCARNVRRAAWSLVYKGTLKLKQGDAWPVLVLFVRQSLALGWWVVGGGRWTVDGGSLSLLALARLTFPA